MTFAEPHHATAPRPGPGPRGGTRSRRLPRPVPLADLVAGGQAGRAPSSAVCFAPNGTGHADALPADPDTTFAALLSDLRAADQSPDLPRTLRRLRARAALLIALADLGGVWSLAETTHALTTLADAALETGLRATLRKAFDEGRLPALTDADLGTSGGMVILAMGKMGAYELNYSSDIDLIVLFDETRFEEADYAAARQGFVKVTQALVKLLSARTAEGYVFRTDLRLRPNPAVTPVCLAMEPAERYYESLGRTWERAAMIKARPAAGDIAAGNAFLKRLAPFVWRRHLDFAAIHDAEDMLVKIRTHKGLKGPITVPGHDMKLGRGGIREIEFFAQTHQLIFGGRNPKVRPSGTTAALAALAEAGQVDAETAARLTDAYTHHREIEHRIQMLDDAQTHAMPTDAEKMARVAALTGERDLARFENAIAARLTEVHALTDISERNEDAPTPGNAAFLERFDAVEADWMTRPAFRSDRTRSIYKRVRPAILTRLTEATDPEAALGEFDTFLGGLPAGVQLFSLFEARPQLLDLLIDVCSVSPALARYLSRNAAILDAVLDQNFFQPVGTAASLEATLSAALAREGDYERTLDAARRWQKEQHFRTGVHLLRGVASPSGAASAYSNIALASLRALTPHVIAAFAERHGWPPGRGAAVIAMGKLGTGEMTASSDLDIIVVYDPEGETESSGPKPLATTAYYARLTQALVNALTAPTSEGKLYDVDLRLRPSGRQGPVATSLAAFSDYQRTKAWTWEHLALTRAAVVAGEAGLGADIKDAIEAALLMPRDAAAVLGDVREMRERIRAAKAQSADPFETKDGAGGLLDIELLVQTGRLLSGDTGPARVTAALPRLAAAGWLAETEATALAEAYATLAAVQQMTRLIGPDAPLAAGSRAVEAAFARATGISGLDALGTRLAEHRSTAAAIIDKRLAADPA